MNKIAEDVIFLKDNLGLMDNRTYESLKARKKSVGKPKVSKGLKTIIMAIIVFIVLNMLFASVSSGVVFAVLYTFVPLVCTYGRPGEYALSLVITYFLSLIIESVLGLSVNDMVITVVVVIIIGFIVGMSIRIIGAKIKEKTSPILPLEEEDEITKRLYQIKERYDIPDYLYSSDWKNIFNYSNIDREITFMRDFEKSEKVQYPLIKIPQEKKINRSMLVKNLLESPISKNIVNQIKDSEVEKLTQLLSNEDDILYVDNDYRECYLKIICELLSKISKFKFNVDEVSKLGEPMVIREYWDDWDERVYRTYIKYPKFSEVVRPLIELNVCRNIESLNRIYETNLKAFNMDLKGTLIGAEGEREVYKTLKDFEKIVGREKMRILPNVRMEPNGQSVESDFIVVCPHGVFALEVKNLGSTGSYNITVEKDGLWKKVMKNGRWKEMPDSISRQNERHLMGIEQVINSKMGNSTKNWISAKSLIVFANNVVGIRNYSNNVIIRDSEIMTEIRKHPICLNEQQINQIAEILLAESLPAKKYKMENWMNKLVGVHLELVQRTQDIYPYLQEYIEIMKAYNYRMVTEVPLPSYQVVQEEISLTDDEKEYRKSVEELEQEKREEQKRKMEEEKRIRERAENFQNNNQSVYGEQSYEQKYFDYDVYMRGETHSVYSEDTRK